MVDLSKIKITTRVGPLDRVALERCLRAARASKEPNVKAHVERILKESGWLPAAELACVYCQISALNLKVWQRPPCEIYPTDIKAILARGDNGTGDYSAARLLKEMFEADLSQYEPDPVRALEAKRRKAS